MKRTSLPRRRKRERSGIRDDSGPLRCPQHLAWIRGFECVSCYGTGGAVRIEAAHVRMGLAGGMGMKPSDDRAVPLCFECHHKQHNHPKGEAGFWEDLNKDPVAIAARLAAQSPALAKLRAKQRKGER